MTSFFLDVSGNDAAARLVYKLKDDDGSKVYVEQQLPRIVATWLPKSWTSYFERDIVSDINVKNDEALRRIGVVFPDLENTTLNAVDSQFTGRGLADCDVDSIVKIDLSYSQVDDVGMREVGECWNVRELSLRRTKITDEGLKHLTGLNRLEQLNLDGTAVSSTGLKSLVPLARTGSLKKLFLYDIPLTDEAAATLAEFSELEELGMRGTTMTGNAVEHLARLKKLKFLQVGSSRMPRSDFDRLREALPNCAVHY